MFGKLMSISDDLMKRYHLLLSRDSASEVGKVIADIDSGSYHPMQAKKDLAAKIVDYYFPKGTGASEIQKFNDRFSKNKIPDDIQTVEVAAGEIKLLDFLRELEFIKSNKEGRRLISQNALKIDGQVHKEETLSLEPGELVLKLGKLRMVKLVVR
jgi:tyrosyl-tRNA synthetase